MDINPGICYQRTLTDYAGIASLFSKLNKKKFIWACSHGIQCRNNVVTEMLKDYKGNSIKQFILQMKAKLSNKLYLFAKKHADEIIVQTQQQQNLIRKNIGLKSIIIPNGHFVPIKIRKSKLTTIL